MVKTWYGMVTYLLFLCELRLDNPTLCEWFAVDASVVTVDVAVFVCCDATEIILLLQQW